jgi:cytochrome c553
MQAERAGVPGPFFLSLPNGFSMRSVSAHSACFALAAAAALASPFASAADAQAGRQRAQLCATCHGPLGLSTMPNTPHLAGQPELYVAEQLRAYRGGKRPHEIMSLIAKPLSDDDIVNLAAWYASLVVEVKEKP